MFLIQILVPITNNQGKRFPLEKFIALKKLLIEKFKGLTVFSHSPAEGLWEKTNENISKDQIIVFEIMTQWKEKDWWKDFRVWLEEEFEQDYIVIRIFSIECI